ncbi:MAG: hypothetical protein RKH07_10890 [Gammaproteobacteria bacterium]
MTFWSNEKIKNHGPKLFEPYIPENVDYSGYKLRVGSQVFVTGEKKPSKRQSYLLEENSHLSIPPGQFAIIQTEEKVTMPKNVMGFISMSSGKKLSGLINVSGFHVDPGYSGRLLFSAFNAGPNAITIDRFEEIFSIWLADLSDPHTKPYPVDKVNDGIDSNRISHLKISEERITLPVISSRVSKLYYVGTGFGALAAGLIILGVQLILGGRAKIAEFEGLISQYQSEFRQQEVRVTQPISVIPSELAIQNIEEAVVNIEERLASIESSTEEIRALEGEVSIINQQLSTINSQIELQPSASSEAIENSDNDPSALTPL